MYEYVYFFQVLHGGQVEKLTWFWKVFSKYFLRSLNEQTSGAFSNGIFGRKILNLDGSSQETTVKPEHRTQVSSDGPKLMCFCKGYQLSAYYFVMLNTSDRNMDQPVTEKLNMTCYKIDLEHKYSWFNVPKTRLCNLQLVESLNLISFSNCRLCGPRLQFLHGAKVPPLRDGMTLAWWKNKNVWFQ